MHQAPEHRLPNTPLVGAAKVEVPGRFVCAAWEDSETLAFEMQEPNEERLLCTLDKRACPEELLAAVNALRPGEEVTILGIACECAPGEDPSDPTRVLVVRGLK